MSPNLWVIGEYVLVGRSACQAPTYCRGKNIWRRCLDVVSDLSDRLKAPEQSAREFFLAASSNLDNIKCVYQDQHLPHWASAKALSKQIYGF